MAATRAVAPFIKFEIHVILIRLEDVCGKVGGKCLWQDGRYKYIMRIPASESQVNVCNIIIYVQS